jgi:hypothetical protein
MDHGRETKVPEENGAMWSDKETDQDCLGFAANVEVLARCCTNDALSPLTLGIFGLWGSGKTGLMKMLKKRIEETNASERVLTLWFNAWRYEGRDEAQSALIHAIVRRISDKRTLGDEARDLLKQILNGASVMKLAKVITKSAITMTPDLDGFLNCFNDESRSSQRPWRFRARLRRLLTEVNVDTVVVFIDDLDRCSSDKVVETFETIKLFLNTPGARSSLVSTQSASKRPSASLRCRSQDAPRLPRENRPASVSDSGAGTSRYSMLYWLSFFSHTLR